MRMDAHDVRNLSEGVLLNEFRVLLLLSAQVDGVELERNVLLVQDLRNS